MNENGDEPKNELKVVEIGTRDAVKASVEESRRNLPAMLEHAKTMAQLRRAYYLAYVEEGFTEAQALELCKS